MGYLINFDYSEEEIKSLEEIMPSIFKQQLSDNYKLVSKNISYLQELGVKNIKEIFNRFYDMFLLDYSTFKGIFDKYDTDSLVEKLSENIEIIDFL